MTENKQELINKTEALKKEKDVLILAHLYEDLDVQSVADFCGDSFELAKKAKASDRKNIVFCGVKFMAESAKILNPDKHVFLPAKDAGCDMANMVTPADIEKLKKEHPKASVVCYINSSAETKAMCDMCVTSSNALKIVKNMEADEIIFVPDKNLGSYIAENVPEKKFYIHSGYCPVHDALTSENILEMKKKHPSAEFLVHPECTKDVLSLADFVGSTSAIIDYVKNSDKNEFIIGTEREISALLKKEYPKKLFHLPSDKLLCKDMKKTTLEGLYETLCDLKDEVILDEDISEKASKCLERMLEAGSAVNK